MKFLFALVFLAAADRAIPANARRFGVGFFATSDEQFYRKYGIIKFPRTLLAVCTCAAFLLHFISPLTQEEEGYIAVVFALLYGISISADVIKARK